MLPYHFKPMPQRLLERTGAVFMLFVLFPVLVVVARPLLGLMALSFVVTLTARALTHYGAYRSRNW